MLISCFLNTSSLASSGRGDIESASATSSFFPGLLGTVIGYFGRYIIILCNLRGA